MKTQTIKSYIGEETTAPALSIAPLDTLDRKIYTTTIPSRVLSKLELIGEKTNYKITSIIRVMTAMYLDPFIESLKSGESTIKIVTASEERGKIRFPMTEEQHDFSQKLRKQKISRSSFTHSFFYYAMYKFQADLVECDMDLSCLAVF